MAEDQPKKAPATSEQTTASTSAKGASSPTPFPAQQPKQVTKEPTLRPPVSFGGFQLRHRILALSFFLLVVLPDGLTALYMWTRAADQYVSTVSFSVRREDSSPSTGFLGGLAQVGVTGGTATDSDILNDFLQSDDLVARLDSAVDLNTRFSRAWPGDRVFAFNPSGTLEDLTKHWQRRVQILYDNSTQLITLRVSAFTPEDALEIADAAFDEGSRMINRLSDIAQEDTIKSAQNELTETQLRLTKARQEVTAFRIRTQIIDPAADLSGQMGVLTSLQSQLAEALVTIDTLLVAGKNDDPRISQIKNRIEAIRKRITEERSKFGNSEQNLTGASYAQLMAEYEKLAADLEFSNTAYLSAQAAFDLARAEARRKSRYLAAHIEPRLAQVSTLPDRPLVVATVFGILLLGWSVMLLIYYSLRDRR
ncbi:capsule biosynthesis protein [uncultured Aliiroseovarius sp.]|uniref:capsule biosynthesis protein n=1 Tax=uncultured Aliiroseovarius sp. TaxID=1658783 RepID=UPI00259447FD|nr:capsule biosynthesis protein [uncultured Aliiroseovarius sp.]